MSIVDLSGTRAVRYPDPPVPRVLPNGVQPYSAYAAQMVYLNGANYDYFIDNTDQAEAPNCQLLLFGTDYPANVLLLQIYGDPQFDKNGDPLPIYPLTIPVEARSTDNIAAILPSIAPAVPSITHYKQIVTGTTLTNGVRVSGFPMAAPVGGNGLYDSGSGDAGGPSSVSWIVYGLLNGAVISSSTAQLSLFDPAAIPFVNFPIILWEGDFTQKMADDGFKFTGTFAGVPDTVFDVVGLWGISGFTPAAPPLLGMGRMAGPRLSPLQQRLEDLRALLPK